MAHQVGKDLWFVSFTQGYQQQLEVIINSNTINVYYNFNSYIFFNIYLIFSRCLQNV